MNLSTFHIGTMNVRLPYSFFFYKFFEGSPRYYFSFKLFVTCSTF